MQLLLALAVLARAVLVGNAQSPSETAAPGNVNMFPASSDQRDSALWSALASLAGFAATSNAGDGFDPPIYLCVTTIHRSDHRGTEIDYLSDVLGALQHEFNDAPPTGGIPAYGTPLFKRLKILVLNMHPHATHPAFERAKKRFGQDPLFVFRDNDFMVHDPWYGRIPEPDNKNNPWGMPGHEVRQQTCDLVAALRSTVGAMLETFPQDANSGVLMLVEDDSKPCPGFARHLRHALHELISSCTPAHRWASLSFSYGMNGIMFRVDLVQHFLRFMVRNMHRLPPDWGIYKDWWHRPDSVVDQTSPLFKRAERPADETTVLPFDLRRLLEMPSPRPGEQLNHLKYKHYTFQHLGKMSSFEFRLDPMFEQRTTPACWSVDDAFTKRFNKRRVDAWFPCEGDAIPK